MTPHVVSVKVYLSVFAALLLLLAFTVGVALVEHPAIGLAIALSIAGIKATLIMLFFMHLRHDTPTVRLAAVVGFAWLSLLIGLSLSDLLTRSWPPATESPATGNSVTVSPATGNSAASRAPGHPEGFATR